MSTKQNYVTLNFNRGVISSLGLARQDIERLSLSAEIQDNLPPRVLGSMMLRAGFQYIGNIYQNNKPYHLKFIYDDDDGQYLAIIELTDRSMRVIFDGSPISRPYVSSGVTNGNFTSNISGWTDADESGASSTYASGGYLSLVGTRYNAARIRQQVSVAGTYRNVEHALNIVVARGELLLKVGSTSGGEEYIIQRTLEKGTHQVAFTPAGDFHIELSNRELTATLVDSCTIIGQGDVVLSTSWLESDLPNIRYDQSGDVVYVACLGQIQKKILRYGGTSWSIVDYAPKDGPFNIINTTTTRLTPSALNGDITLTSSTSLFTEDNIGSLYRLNSIGQTVEIDATGGSQWSDPIRVTGVGSSQRQFNVIRSGTWSATVTLQRSLGEIGAWTDVQTYTTNSTSSISDGLDNQIVFYRVGIDSGDYTSGTAGLSLVYDFGGISGVVKITGYTSKTSVSASVLKELGSTVATEDWEESSWSPRRGYPSALALHDGRLYHGGLGKIFASASDGYEVFDSTIEGESAPFSRNIPKGSQSVKWMLSLKRLMFGTFTHEWFLRSSSYDEIVTDSNANVKSTSNQGCDAVQGIEVDGVGMFVQKSKSRLLQSGYTVEADDFKTEDVSKIIPEFLEAGIVRIDVQRQPDTRIHCVLSDGTVCILVLDDLEDVKSWFTVSTDGEVEDVIVLSGSIEDDVYYSVKRNINGSDVRYLEKWAMESECRGGTLNKQADSFIIYTGASTSTISGLDHLEGEEVVVWADGADLSPDNDSGVQRTYTVTSGSITLDLGVTNAIVGLPYRGRYKSVKLSLQSKVGTSLGQIKIIKAIGLILKNTLKTAIKYGDSFDEMYNLQDMEDYGFIPDGTIYEHYDNDSMEFSGSYETDSRIYLEVRAPRPCTVLSCIAEVVMNEKNQGK